MSHPNETPLGEAAPAEAHPDHAPRAGLVVVGVDGSDSSVEALRHGFRIATAFHTNLVCVIAWNYPVALSGYMTSGWSPEEDAESVLLDVTTRVFGEDPPLWCSGIVRQGRPAQVLLVESSEAEMLVVGSRGHGGFVGMLLGSVSAAVAEYATCPVLIVHTGGAAQET